MPFSFNPEQKQAIPWLAASLMSSLLPARRSSALAKRTAGPGQLCRPCSTSTFYDPS